MCGINGIIQFNQNRITDDLRKIVHNMNEQIIHRGPDDEGLFADELCSLGMRRLSIIDIAGGNQPIWNPDHTKVIVYNGEIYNFKILRDELIKAGYSFRTNSDTEVILLGYEEYGVITVYQKDELQNFAETVRRILDGEYHASFS